MDTKKQTNLKRIREEASLSQQELADASGVARSTIAPLELGERRMQPRTRRKLAAALGVEPKELLER